MRNRRLPQDSPSRRSAETKTASVIDCREVRPSSASRKPDDLPRTSTPLEARSSEREAAFMTTDAPAVDKHATTLKTLHETFGDGVFSMSQFRDNLRLFVLPSRLIELLSALKERCGFGLLSEI